MFRFSGLADLCRFVGYVKEPEERESTVDCRGNWRFATRSNWLALESLPSLRKMVKVLKT